MAENSATFTLASAAYERVMVPAVFGPWAKDLLDTVRLVAATAVLDVACGTDIVARTAALHVGPNGRVAGLDSNAAMLAVARELPATDGARIEWQQGNAISLPFADGDFDTVLCQQGLQYMPDRRAALQEMKRVLASAGQLGLTVFRQSIGYEVFERTAARFVGAEAAAIMREPFACGDLHELSELLENAGLAEVRIYAKTLAARFLSSDDFINYQLGGRLAGAVNKLNDDARVALITALRKTFEPYSGPQGLTFPMEAQVIVARR
jgi:ubiquinone/menaquinone biosynthesis C-methylase UbiE